MHTLVKQRFSHLSETLMYEWARETPTRYNMGRRQYYAYWQTIKNLLVIELEWDDLERIDKIEQLQRQQLRKPRYR